MNGETVVRLAASTAVVDGYGDPTVTWTPAGTYTAPVWPRTSSEGPGTNRSDASRSEVVVGMAVALPRETAVSPRDRFQVRGDVYEVDGEPADYRSPFSARGLVIVNLRRVEG